MGQEQLKRFRPQGTERQQMTTPADLAAHRAPILGALKQLGFADELLPPTPQTSALLVLGAAEGGVRGRLNAAAGTIESKKLMPEEIILVTGARDLWPNDSNGEMKGESITLELLVDKIADKEADRKTLRANLQSAFDAGFKDVDPKSGVAVGKAREQIAATLSEKYKILWPTEADMMFHLASTHTLLSKTPISLVNAPKIEIQKDGKTVMSRPTTQSTLEETLATHGRKLEGKTVAVLSSHPNCQYQHGVVASVLGKTCHVQMVASAVSETELASDAFLVRGLEGLFSSVYSHLGMARESLRSKTTEVGTVLNNVQSSALCEKNRGNSLSS